MESGGFLVTFGEIEGWMLFLCVEGRGRCTCRFKESKKQRNQRPGPLVWARNWNRIKVG